MAGREISKRVEIQRAGRGDERDDGADDAWTLAGLAPAA
jgi:hypothetical protein